MSRSGGILGSIPHRSSHGNSSGNHSIGNHDDALRRMSKLVNSFFSRSDCIPFREPVDWRGLELWDYPKIIKKMMDLGTVKRKLEKGQYETAAECADDIRLIWTNCMTYNADGSDFFLLAESFSRKFEDRYRKIKQEFDTGENLGKSGSSISSSGKDGSKRSGTGSSSSPQMEPPSLEAKTKFGSNLFRLTGVQFGHVLQVLDLRCPRALERPASVNDANNHNQGSQVNDGEEVEINVDVIDLRTFYELDTYVKERISKSRRKMTGTNHSSLGSANGGMQNNQHGSSVSEEYPPSSFMMSGNASTNASVDSDIDAGTSGEGGGRSSSGSYRKIGKRKR